MNILLDDSTFPESAGGSFGRFYKPATGTIKLDRPGADSGGVSYYDY